MSMEVHLVCERTTQLVEGREMMNWRKHGQRLHLSASQLNAYASAFENDFVKEAQEHV